MSEENLYKPGTAYAAAGVTRSEVQTWLRNGWLATDPAVPKHGGGRMYSRRNVLEFAVFKRLVSGDIRCCHAYAVEVLGELCDRIEAGEQVFLLTQRGLEERFDPAWPLGECGFGMVFKAPAIDLS